MTRSEHLAWAKERALAEISRTSGFAGWVCFKHDMQKHPELANHSALEIGDEMVKMIAGAGLRADPIDLGALRVFDLPGPMNMVRFIEGFN